MTDWKREHDAELGLRREWSERAQIAEAENKLLRVAIGIARQNIISLCCAYPDRFPRHAFQSTIDLLAEALADRAEAA